MRLAFSLAGAVLLTAASSVFADQKAKPAPPPKPAPAAKIPGAPKGNASKAGGAPKKGIPRINNPGLAQRLLQMTPDQREKVLEKLPPEQQAQLRKNLDRLDHLPQRERDHIISQATSLDSLPQQQRRIVVQQLRAFNKLPDDRILPVRRELVNLMRLPEDQRETLLNSQAFRNSFSPEEQDILRDLSRNLPLDYLPDK